MPAPPQASAPAPTPGPTRLTLDLAATVRHDGRGGVADDLDTPEGLTAWVREHADALPEALAARRYRADAAGLDRVRAVRSAVRALFARAVLPGAPSPADAHRLPPPAEAVARLNEAAAKVSTVPVLTWPGGAAPRVRDEPVPAPGPASPDRRADLLDAALARAAHAFLAGPDRQRLRACHAPRCVRYFLKEHPRQEWCKPSCGNRARVARHHERGRGPA
ncbi:CGNR zinc finger domain-containing protein [Streptomyces sp. AN091965]|uniref:CGNR zinc finger domain-containing protein n=1 Tax=Streptomyces sp. AN091965 TaxID=2927803 RepID=UPI001F60A0D8|nr:CGNR zinc finger domain-containing protein [Streptomyces sp. AN091965]MCI3935212.1 ABATE domain-containing protein [Streptomyces sp. AN091965]